MDDKTEYTVQIVDTVVSLVPLIVPEETCFRPLDSAGPHPMHPGVVAIVDISIVDDHGLPWHWPIPISTKQSVPSNCRHWRVRMECDARQYRLSFPTSRP